MGLFEDAVQERRQELEAYCEKNGIMDLIQELIKDTLKARPEGSVKSAFARSLRASLQGGQAVHDMPLALLLRLFESAKRITSEIGPKDAIGVIIQETLQLIECDRVSLFVHDQRINTLVLNASNLEQPIRVKPGQGIAGHVFKNRASINIPDCSKDSRFDSSFDQKTGYTTKNLLAMPIIDFNGECTGVLQAINKSVGPSFTRVDEFVLETLAEHASICLRNMELYRSAIVLSERTSALLRMVQGLSQDLGVQSTVLTVTMHATEVVQADRCTLFFVDEAKQQLWSVATDSGKEIRIPCSVGIAGECSREGKIINVEDAYQDPRFNQQVDKATGYRTRSILAVPIQSIGSNRQGHTFAVLQMVNKTDFDGEVGVFNDDDVEVLESFASYVACKLQGSKLFSAPAKGQSEAAMAFGDLTPQERSQHKATIPGMPATLAESVEECC